MQLFKRLLLSYFPDALVQNAINPASMFVSFISSKDFFSIINRKIVENYKLNLFDLAHDMFEFKVGLGQNTATTQAHMTDTYYSYLVAANFNGYKFYNISNTANALVLASSLYLWPIFEDEDSALFVDCLYAFYLLSFLFASRIKVFPWVSEQADFNWFIDLFFDFYGVVTSQLKHKISKERFVQLRKKIVSQLEVFFLMFYYYRRLNQLFAHTSSDKDYFGWLFGEQMTSSQKSLLVTYGTSKHSSKISLLEEDILFEVAPADIHLKYVFLDNDPQVLVHSLVSEIYDKGFLDQKLSALMKNPKELDFVLDYVMDPANFKKAYFSGIQRFMVSVFQEDSDPEIEEFNEMMSIIWNDSEKFDRLHIPARIKKESRILEQLLNFYITYLWGLATGRSDSFFLRMYKPDLLQRLLAIFEVTSSTAASIHLYGWQQYFYSHNDFYYAYVNKNVRSGKEKFFVPLVSKAKAIKSTVFSLTMFDEMALISLLQDMNPKLCKLYVKNKAVLDRFKKRYASSISDMMQLSQSDFIASYYQPFFSGFGSAGAIIALLQDTLVEHDISRLKDSLYGFDLWIFRSLLEKLPWQKLNTLYTEQALLNILSFFRELFPGFLLYYHFVLQQDAQQKKSAYPQLLVHTLLLEIIGIDDSLFLDMKKIVDQLLEEFSFPLTLFVEFDDNKQFFSLLWDNWKEFLLKPPTAQGRFSVEDLLWLRWALKHITYYNKRYLVPG